MKVLNPLTLNDWPIKKFIILVFSIHISVLGLICFDFINLNIPILRYIVCFIYLTFLPGLLILRIFGFHKLGNVETFLYSAGLSISILMFTGFFSNLILPFIGVKNPLSSVHLIFVIYLIISVLALICWIMDKYSNPDYIEFSNFDNSLYFFLLLPFLSIIGTYLKNSVGSNSILILLILIICISVIFIGFELINSKNLYPLFVFLISISLLYHSSLISDYLWGTDVQKEYYVSNLVKTSGLWTMSTNNNLYSVLSVTSLAPIYSSFLDIDIRWLFKVFYPILFSFVPLGMYTLFEKQSNEIIAFFSCFFFMSVTPFYTIMLEATRQQISELFFVLVLLLISNKEITKVKRTFLIVIFSFSLAVSHYGLSYIYLFSIIFTCLILLLDELIPFNTIFHYISFEKTKRGFFEVKQRNINNDYRFFSLTFVFLMSTFTLAWYMYISSSSVFDIIISTFYSMINSLKTGFFNPDEVEALNAIIGNLSIFHNITKYLHLLTQLLIFVGIISSLTSRNKLEKEYLGMSLFFFGICFVSLVLPNTSVTMGTSRVYSICLIPLALFFTVGSTKICNKLNKLIRVTKNGKTRSFYKLFSVFLAIFFLFNSGLIYHLAQDNPSSISLDNIRHPRVVYNDEDFFGVQWAVQNKEKNEFNIYTGACDKFLLYNFIDEKKINVFTSNTIDVASNSYILLGPLSIQDHEIVNSYFEKSGFRREYLPLESSNFYNKVVSKSSKIYNNGGINIILPA